MTTRTANRVGLKHILIGSLIIWAAVCVVMHGSAIVAYIALQAATSGVFAFAFWRAEKTAQQTRNVPVRNARTISPNAPKHEAEASLVGAA